MAKLKEVARKDAVIVPIRGERGSGSKSQPKISDELFRDSVAPSRESVEYGWIRWSSDNREAWVMVGRYRVRVPRNSVARRDGRWYIGPKAEFDTIEKAAHELPDSSFVTVSTKFLSAVANAYRKQGEREPRLPGI